MSTNTKLAEQAAKAVPADLRSAAERTRQDLGPTGSNYPDVRVLLAFAEQALAAPTPPAPEALQAAGQEQDERAAFEIWADNVFYNGLASVSDTWNDETGRYFDAAHFMAWKAWQARAALAQRREPLQDSTLWGMWVDSPSDVLAFARRIERHYGIGATTGEQR